MYKLISGIMRIRKFAKMNLTDIQIDDIKKRIEFDFIETGSSMPATNK